MKRLTTLLTIFLLLFLLAACNDMANQLLGSTPTSEPPTPTAILAPATVPPTAPPTIEPTAETAVTTETITGLAAVDSVEIQESDSFPIEVAVRARGDLTDGCTLIESSTSSQAGTTFTVVVSTIRPANRVCTQALVPFEEIIPLDVTDLPAGTYTVDVNGITGSFTLSVDNNAAAAAQATAESNGLINGRVWHDLCAIARGTDGTPAIPSAGCVAVSAGAAYEANGTLEDGEPGLEGVLVNLGTGSCPSSGLATTLTDADGDYVFGDLPADNYCVSIDSEATENATLLPGTWTFPGIGETAVTLAAGEIKTDVNFGWDFELLPEANADLLNCTNSLAFVSDLSIPDDTIIAPGAEFEKGWRLRNTGTCPWTTQYTLIFAGGDQMGATTAVTLTELVAPNQELDLFVPFTAPEAPGPYRSDWLMADGQGIAFGVDGLPTEVIWTKIVVGTPEVAPETTPTANSAAIGGVVWDDVCFIRTDGTASAGCTEIAGTFVGDGSLINEARLAGITVILADGACPDTGTPAPSAILESTVTDEDGLYRFINLDEGLYCVAIDALSPANVDLLIPGNWTWPALGTGRQGINLAAGEERLEVDFGWDFQE